MNNWRGLFVDGALALANMDQDSLAFRNNIIAGDFTSTWTAPYAATKSLAAEDVTTRPRLLTVAYANDSLNTCSLLVNAWNFTNPDYRPNTGGDGTVVTDPATINSGADLNLFTATDAGLFSPLAAFDFVATVAENGAGTTNGIITVTIAKAPGWQVTVPGLTLVLNAAAVSGTSGNSTVDDGNGNPTTANENGNWLFRETAASIIATSKVGTIIPKSGSAILGFRFARRAATTTGTSQSLGFSVSGGGDNTSANNAAVIILGTQN